MSISDFIDTDLENTDIHKFAEMYLSFGVDCKVNPDENGGFQITLAESNIHFGERDRITISKCFFGYNGFFSTIHFDGEGKFVKQGFWE